MLGVDRSVCGEEAILNVGEHGVRPTKGRMTRGGAIASGDMALMDDPRLFANTAKPLATLADDPRTGLDIGAQPLGFAGLKAAHDLQTCI